MSNLKNSYKYYFIYKTINLINNHGYVGFHATNKEFDEDDYIGSGTLFNKKVLEYGEDKFIMGKIENIKPEVWREKEIYWIKKMDTHVSLGHGYNLTWGGDGGLGYKHTEETKQKLRKPKSEEHKEKLRIAQTGKKATEETIKNMSNAHKGYKQTPEHIENSATAHRRKKRTEETKQKMRDVKKGKILNKHLKGIKKPRKICIYCNREIDIFNFQRWHGDNCKYKDKPELLAQSKLPKIRKKTIINTLLPL